MPDNGSVPVWCEVDLDALRANVGQLRKNLSPQSRLGIVVKSEAYGHGLVASARGFVGAGADWLVVNSVEEAETLRQHKVEAPLYICGPFDPAWADRVATCKARVVIYGRQQLKALGRAGQAHKDPVPVHIKVETGTHRQGIGAEQSRDLAREVVNTPGVRLEGLTTHFADIEDTTEHRFARQQLDQLVELAARLRTEGVEPLMVHSANSAAALLWPQTHGDLVRVGVAAYGLWPSRETYATALQRSADGSGYQVPSLRPVLSWKTRVTQVKTVAKGAYIGYGRTFRTTHPMKIAVLPVGYFEGYDRRLSNIAHVLIKGVRAPVRGRVCMNMTMVDISDIPGVSSGETATLMGVDGDEVVSAEMLAGWMGTINYEVVCRIHPGLPRRLVKNT